MDFEDGRSALDVRRWDEDLTVESARPEECLVQDVDSICSGQDNNIGSGVEALKGEERDTETLPSLNILNS